MADLCRVLLFSLILAALRLPAAGLPHKTAVVKDSGGYPEDHLAVSVTGVVITIWGQRDIAGTLGVVFLAPTSVKLERRRAHLLL